MSRRKVSPAVAALAALVRNGVSQAAPRPNRVGPALPPEPKAPKPRMRVKVIRHVVELWEVKASDKKTAKDRALRGMGKRRASSTTAKYASVVKS